MKDTIRNISILMGICVVLLSFTSCAGMPRKTAKTPARTYEASFDDAYKASIKAFQNLGLDIFKQDKEKGYVEGGRKPGFGRGSENVGVFIEMIAPAETKVSIDNRKAFAGCMFAVDWTDKLFDQIGQELKR